MASKKTPTAPVKRAAPKEPARPKAPKPSPEAIAESARGRLVGALDGLRRLGPSSYPPTVERWLQIAEVEPKLLKTALDPRIRFTAVFSAAKKSPAANAPDATPGPTVPRAFFEEDEALAIDALLEPLLRAARTPECTVFAPGELGKGLEKSFKAALEKRAMEGPRAGGPWPEGLGTLLRDGKRWLFLRDDVTPRVAEGSRAAARPAASASSSPGFAARFDEAFTKLDRAASNANYVLLSDLRRSLADVDRRAFDDGLNALRRADRFTLDSADGRHQRLPQEALDAGIREGSTVLVYAARRP